ASPLALRVSAVGQPELPPFPTRRSSDLARKEIYPVYQPQIELATGRIIGAEALMRWERPRQGLVSPASFIPIAEDSGLILPLGRSEEHTSELQSRETLVCRLLPETRNGP